MDLFLVFLSVFFSSFFARKKGFQRIADKKQRSFQIHQEVESALLFLVVIVVSWSGGSKHMKH